MTKGRRSRLAAGNVSPVAWAMMTDDTAGLPRSWERFDLNSNHRAKLRPIWTEYGAGIVEAWAMEHPGSRPSCWWDWTAPRAPVGTYPGCWYDSALVEPRKRLGGIGTAQHEVWSVMPCFALGIPVSWVDEDDPDGKWVTPDPHSPPLFESQAAYLRRLGLLLPGELRRLGPEDFLPEPILVAE